MKLFNNTNNISHPCKSSSSQNCIICGSKDEWSHIGNWKQYCRTKNHFWEFNVVEVICKNCGHVCQGDAPGELFWSYYYADKFEHIGDSLDFDAESRVNTIKKYLNSGSSIFEVGGNNRKFWQSLESEGFYVDGHDPVSKLEGENNKKLFDAVIGNHVLEHIVDPVSFLKDLSKKLKNDGFFIFEVPNLYNYISCTHPIFHEHLHHFTPCSFKTVFEKSGFEIVEMSFSNVSRDVGMVIVAKKNSKPISFFCKDSYLINKRYMEEALSLKLNADSNDLVLPVMDLKDSGKYIVLWGVNPILYKILVSNDLIFSKNIIIVDADSLKHDQSVIPGVDLKIKSPSELKVELISHVYICAISWEREIRSFLINNIGIKESIISIAR